MCRNFIDMNETAINPEKFERFLSLITKINSALDLNTILVSIMEAAKDIMEAEASSLMLTDLDTGELIFAVPTGPASVDLSGKRIPKGKGIGGWVAQNDEAIAVKDVKEDERFLGDTDNFVTKSIACVPMHNSSGEVIGVLQAINKVKGYFSKAELNLFSALGDQAAISIEKARFQQEAIEKERMEREINLAKTIQEGLFPKHIPSIPTVQFAGKSLPAREVGGDYYDFIELSNGSVLVILADISGKGVGASLVMVELRAIIHLLAHSSESLQTLLTKTNTMLVEDTPSGTFVTLFAAIINPVEHKITYCNAGHNPPWLLKKDEVKELIEGGPILGFMKNLPFEVVSTAFEIGDKLIIYTDGFTEGERSDEEQYGEERLLEAFQTAKGSASVQLEFLFKELEKFVDGAEPSDDRTAIVVTCN